MPELPEVETVRRGLEPTLAGQRLVRIEQRRPNLRFPFPENFARRLTGQRVTHLGRRAKYLMAQLSGGDVLVVHLGMSGRIIVTPPPAPTPGSASVPVQLPLASSATVIDEPPRAPGLLGKYTYGSGSDPAHDHVVFHLSSGAIVTYNDPRRFGFMQLIPAASLDTHPLFAHLGVEPLGNAMTAAHVATRAAGRKTDLKAFLMDQRIVAGLGNIYVCEALHRAGLSPSRSAACLADRRGRPTARAERLVPAIRTVLEAAIDAGGSTLRDYRHADGALGNFQHAFHVYGRQGAPCVTPDCSSRIRRIVQAGRSTFYCSACQR